MARFALIRADGTVDTVIVAEPDVAASIASELGRTAREVVTELEQPVTSDAVVSRRCEPGARLVERAAADGERERARRHGGRHVVEDFEREE